MFLSVKKNTLVAIALVVITVVSLCLLIFPLSISSSADPLGKTIVIDAGHGGIDGGVQGVNTGTKESDINLAISRELKRVLQKNGYKVVMTRQNTDGLYGLSSKNKKQKDMQTRKEIIEQAKADLVVSIHQNQYPRMNVRGAQVFYAPGSETGKTMAEKMQAALNTNLEACTRTAHEGDYYILQCSSTPSLLIECGFLSNPEDEKLLLDTSYREKIAYTIFTGINNILGITTTSLAS
ncbi:MAG: N-acetylmuramoyl-L-alanine amidase [Clostridia bacterium]|nr:N-acetylmuramoyl-L-alanine amidase [Clostridia bacterium]